MLGGKSNVAGSYELGIDSIWAVNEEDLPSKHGKWCWELNGLLLM